MMPHPLIPVSLPPASVTMAMSQMNHLSTIANMAAAAQGQTAHHNGLSMNQALLGLSPNLAPGPKEGDLAHDMSHEVKRMHTDKGVPASSCSPHMKETLVQSHLC
ncbi:hypothetical protein XENOCAPTIV_012300 [Xenoophorus captivus]|uniref:Uncharacterized protein n=1 Tax=Xenoophorus captivus TaxID=1517983 RepID=A0ABV0RAQ8_9TELE